MFFPKNFKYKNSFMLIKKNLESKTNKVVFGTVGIKSMEHGFLKASHIESIRKIISKRVKRSGKFWIRVFPRISITSKPSEVRMGKGKGSHLYWACFVKKGRMLFEIEGLEKKEILEIVFLCNQKLPVKVKAINKY